MDHGRAHPRIRGPHLRGRPGKLIAAARHWAGAKPRKVDDGPGSAKAFNITVAGWKPREPRDPGDGEETSFPHPERQELLQRIDRLERTGDHPDELERAKARYERLAGAFPVWPQNERSVQAFLKVRTQWRTGANGAVGLDYPAVQQRIERLRLSPEDQERVLEDIELMESIILATWGEESERRTRELEAKGNRR